MSNATQKCGTLRNVGSFSSHYNQSCFSSTKHANIIISKSAHERIAITAVNVWSSVKFKASKKLKMNEARQEFYLKCSACVEHKRD